MVVGARSDLAIVAEEQGGRRGDRRRRGEADHGGVAQRRGAEHGERVGRCAGEGRRDRPAGVGELVQPAKTAPMVVRSELVVCRATLRLSELAPDSVKPFWVTLETCSRANGVMVADAGA